MLYYQINESNFTKSVTNAQYFEPNAKISPRHQMQYFAK